MAEERVHRRLAAIMAADVVGYSRLMGEDEAGTLAALKALRADLIDPTIAEYGGRIVKLMGDGALVEFSSVVDAVECAAGIQHGIATQGDGNKISFRIGINLGDVIIDGDDIYGDGVNVAARLEALAEPGGICVSEVVHQSVEGKLDLSFADMGAQEVKNIAKPVRAYQVILSGEPEGATNDLAQFDKPSLAVMPFDNLSGDPDKEFFADGLTEDLITALSYWHTFYVISRHSTFRYKGQSRDIRQVAHDLGVQYVLEGSVQTAGDRVRITAQLIDAATGRHVWAERYDRQLEDFFALQDEITQEIAGKLEPAFAKAEQQKASRKPSTNLAAWEWYQRGIASVDAFTKSGNIRARECFQRASDLDPTDSRPLAYLAYSHFRFVFDGYATDPEAEIAQVIDCAKRALALDDGDPIAHFAYSIGLTFSGKPELGIPEARRAVELNPNYSHAYIPLGNGLNLAGNPGEAVPCFEMAVKLNPNDVRSHIYITYLAEAHLNDRDYERAIDVSRRAIQRRPDYAYAHFVLASALGHTNQIAEAEVALEACLDIRPDFIETHPQLGLYKHPADREHILEGLRKAGWIGSSDAVSSRLPDKPSIAVLPFDNLSGDPKQEYFSDGLAEDLITDLSKVSGLFVVARNSAFAFKGQPIDVRQVAKELGVRHVLEGSVRKAGGKVRINAQLIDVASGGHIWADRYDGDLEDIFSLQDNITAQIVGALEINLTAAEQAVTRRPLTNSVEAYELFLQARTKFYQFTPQAFKECQKLYERAITIDPAFSAAYANLVMPLQTGWSFVWPEYEDALATARDYAEKAVAIDGDLPLAHTRLGWVHTFMGQHDAAIASFERALELSPNDADALAYFAEALNFAGDPERAIEMTKMSLRFDPLLPPNCMFHWGHSCYLLGRYDEAIDRLSDCLSKAPGFAFAHVMWATTCSALGRLEEAAGQLDIARQQMPGETLLMVIQRLPWRSEDVRTRLLDSLRKAGLPE